MDQRLSSRIVITLLLSAALFIAACQPIAIPEPTPTSEPPMPDATVLIDGLLNPRQISYDNDGTLYIAETGIAGTTEVVLDEERTINAGMSSRVTALSSEGEHTVILPSLPSVQTRPGDTGFRGAMAVLATDNSYWVAMGEGPAGFSGFPFHRTVLQIDRATMRIGHVIDTMAAATAAGQPDPAAVNSDPTDLALTDDGTLLIADAGCNCLWSWTEEDGIQLAASWTIEDNPVPTGVDTGPNGDIYVSFLSGFPFAEGSARIERWSGGALTQVYEGLTLLTDVLVTDDGSIYAVQFAVRGENGFEPNSGQILNVTDEGATTVMDGLVTPYSLAQAPDGSIVFSAVSAFHTEGGGVIIALDE